MRLSEKNLCRRSKIEQASKLLAEVECDLSGTTSKSGKVMMTVLRQVSVSVGVIANLVEFLEDE